MSESQLERPAAWRKAHRRRLALVGLGPVEMLLVLVLDVVGVRDATRLAGGAARPDVGWATREDGRPLSRRELAALVRLAPGAAGLAELDAAIAGLVELGHVVVADDGAVGVAGWAEQQESLDERRARDDERRARDAERKRAARAASADKAGHSADAARADSGRGPDGPRTGPGLSADPSRETSDVRGQISSDDDARAPAPVSLGRRIQDTRTVLGLGLQQAATRATAAGVPISEQTLRRIEADEARPTRRELGALARVLGDPSLAEVDVAEPDGSVVEQVVAALHDARAELGAEERRPRIDAEAIREVTAPEPWLAEGMPLLDAWLTVIRRAAEEARRNAEDGRGSRDLEFMTLRHLGGDRRWRRYLAESDLDRRRAPRQRGSPKSAGHVVVRSNKFKGAKREEL